MLYVVIVSALAFIGLSYYRAGEVVNPVSVLVTWWCFWLALANVNPVGLYVPSAYTQFLYLLMLGSMTVGGLIARPLTASDAERENERAVRKWRWVAFLLVPLSLIIAALFYKAYSTYLTNLALVGRGDIFGSNSVLFPGQIAQMAYTAISRPVLLVGLIAGLTLFIMRGRRLLLGVITVLYLMDAIMMLGRRELYMYVLVAGFVLFVMVRGKASRRVRRVRFFGSLIAIGLAGAILLLTSWRLGDTFDVGRIAERYVVQYHTGGFTIFDQDLQDPDSRLNTHLTLGRSTLGTIEKASVLLFFRRVGGDVRSEVNDTGSYFLDFRKVGYGVGGPGIYMNAYNTLLYTIYIDGREVAVIGFSMLFGYFLMGHYLAWRRQQRAHSMMVATLLTAIGLLGLFNSPLEGPELWGGLFILVLINRVRLPVPVLSPSTSD
jgi:oligosaccharide repeat unit polymerase